MRNFTTVLVLALIAALFPSACNAAGAADHGVNQGAPRNRWRYEFYAGRWWYWKPDAQWSYFDGRTWVDWGREPPHPTGTRRHVASDLPQQNGRRTMGYRATGVYPFNYSGENSPNSGLHAGSAPGNAPLGTASGFGSRTIAGGGVGVGLETGSRSGDASSGVGGGSVGGADVSGWNQRK